MTGYESKKKAAQDKLDSMEREALKLALDWAEAHGEAVFSVGGTSAVTSMNAWAAAIKEALAQPAQEPVGFVDSKLNPIQRPWVGLTNDDWNSTPYDTEFRAGVEWAEAKLKEKNNG